MARSVRFFRPKACAGRKHLVASWLHLRTRSGPVSRVKALRVRRITLCPDGSFRDSAHRGLAVDSWTCGGDARKGKLYLRYRGGKVVTFGFRVLRQRKFCGRMGCDVTLNRLWYGKQRLGERCR